MIESYCKSHQKLPTVAWLRCCSIAELSLFSTVVWSDPCCQGKSDEFDGSAFGGCCWNTGDDDNCIYITQVWQKPIRHIERERKSWTEWNDKKKKKISLACKVYISQTHYVCVCKSRAWIVYIRRHNNVELRIFRWLFSFIFVAQWYNVLETYYHSFCFFALLVSPLYQKQKKYSDARRRTYKRISNR